MKMGINYFEIGIICMKIHLPKICQKQCGQNPEIYIVQSEFSKDP